MATMDFGAVISRALRITWNYKILWILGFLAALGSGGANFNPSSNINYRAGSSDFSTAMPPWLQDLVDDPGLILGGLAAFFCIILIIGFIIMVISTIARGGLIAGVQQIETEGNTTFGRAWSGGASRFLPLLGLDILLFLPVIIVVVVLVALFGGSIIAAVASSQGGVNDNGGAIGGLIAGGLSIFCCGLCVVILYSLLAQAIQVLGERAIVLEGAGVISAISRAWALLRANLGNIILLALVMLVISFAFGLITAVIAGAALLPGMGLAFTDLNRSGALQAGTTILVVILVIVAMIVGAIVQTLFITFNSAAWTLAFRQFTGAAPAVAAPVAPPPLPTA
jgi:hypothetical protein